MNAEGLGFLGAQLLYIAPSIFVQLAAIVLAIVFLNRARLPALLALAAAATGLLTSLVVLVLQSSLISRVNDGTMRHADIEGSLRLVGLGGSLLHGACLALFVAAIFVGRKPASAAPVS